MESAEDEMNERILALATQISHEIHLFTAAHGKTRETLVEVLMALHLIHMEIQEG